MARKNQIDGGELGVGRFYAADEVWDGVGGCVVRGGLFVAEGRVVVAGELGEVEAIVKGFGGEVERIEMGGWALLPGLVNGHAHLELTKIGRREYSGDFIEWVRMLREQYPSGEDVFCEANQRYFAEAAEEGMRRSLDGGVLMVGNITRFESVRDVVGGSELSGVSFMGMFGMGEPWDEEALRMIGEVGGGMVSDVGGKRHEVGLSPHAPYSAGLGVFEGATRSSVAVCTHLAEMVEEAEFISEGKGRWRDFLVEIGKWDEAFGEGYGRGEGPIEWMEKYLKRKRWLCAHCNYVSDDDIGRLARYGASVAYCPRASDYFGHSGHRYREMIDAGVNVCLGTDSIVCHGTLSVLDEMRYLYKRDGVDVGTLVRMATVNGARALGGGFDEGWATLEEGARAGVIGVRCCMGGGLERVLGCDDEIEVKVLEVPGRNYDGGVV